MICERHSVPSETSGYARGGIPCRNEAGGFTLIETLVAMMILSISIVVIFQLFSGGLKSARLSEDYTRAVFHAREKMEEVLLAEKLGNDVSEGEFGDGFRWKTQIVYLEPPEDEKQKQSVDMFNIRVEVVWFAGRHEKHFEISTLKIAEKMDDP